MSTGAVQSSISCCFTFDLGTVALTDDFYSAEVTRRGRITNSRADLEANGGKFELSLGGR